MNIHGVMLDHIHHGHPQSCVVDFLFFCVDMTERTHSVP